MSLPPALRCRATEADTDVFPTRLPVPMIDITGVEQAASKTGGENEKSAPR